MLEDGLEDIDKLMTPEKEEQQEAMKQAHIDSDAVGANYLKVVNSVSFADLSIYTVELLVSEQGIPEVKEGKEEEINNLLNYDVFEEVKDEG